MLSRRPSSSTSPAFKFGGAATASIRIKRVTETTYNVRLYDRVAGVDLGDMSEKRLHMHLTARHLVNGTPSEVIGALEVGEETTVRFLTEV